MSQSVVPLDPFNPGQVFACLGLLELADRLCGTASGCFKEQGQRFHLNGSKGGPVSECLRFILEAQVKEITSFLSPEGKEPDNKQDTAAPVILKSGTIQIRMDHWEEEKWSKYSGRYSMKLYSGNRTAFNIVTDMQDAIRSIMNKIPSAELIADPFNFGVELTGRFNFDPRAGWTSLDMGFSPNQHKYSGSRFRSGVLTFPIVELFAALGMQYARPKHVSGRSYKYQVWREPVPPVLARPVLGCAFKTPASMRFVFDYTLSGKNKVLCFSRKENDYE